MSFNNLPPFDQLPNFSQHSGCAWDVWGKDDELGTVNLLTDEVVQRAASEGIQPFHFSALPIFNRQASPVHKIIQRTVIARPATNDDELQFDTQSGTHWDGLRHMGIHSHGVFYQGVGTDKILKGKTQISDPLNIDPDLVRLGIHAWAQHGICGRGVFIDLVKFYTESGTKPLPYDPWTCHSIPVMDIKAAAKKQRVEFRQADILLIRMGFMQRLASSSHTERNSLGGKPGTFAGLEQSVEMKEFLWNNHFAAVASDQPALERCPAIDDRYLLRETLLGLWGMPIGHFFDLETLSKVAEETGRYTFFFSSWPLNVLGGVASPANATAIF